MRKDKRVLGIVFLLAVLFSISLVFGLGVVDISKLASTPVEPALGPTTVFVDPWHVLDDTKQAGSYVEIHINISDVSDLYAWQVNITWNPDVLNFTRIVAYGDFLARTSSPNGTSRIYDFVYASNATGYAAIAESILGGDYPGISGNGRLVTIEFNVVGYGYTDLTISTSGNLSTTLLNSARGSITIDATADGYFRNLYYGDIDGDKYVGSADASVLNMAYGTSCGDPLYIREADFDDDCYIGSVDAGVLGGAYGTTYP